MSFDGGDFESWLDQGLGKALNAQAGPSPLATQASYHAAYLSGGVGMSSFGAQVVAALTSKVAIGGATAAIIVGGGTAAAAAAGGSANPTNWGQFISQTVVPNCKDQAASAGMHGIGQCVSSIARLHGQEVASAARHHGSGEGTVHGKASEARGREEAGEAGQNGAENGSGKPSGNPGLDNKPTSPGSQGGDHGAPPKH
jgi:hypothetical protein